MYNLLHISPNQFPALEIETSTKRIWKELAKGYNEYHVFGRSLDNRFHNYQEDNIRLHLIPKIKKGNRYALLTYWIIPFYIKKYNIDLILCQCPIIGGYQATKYSKRKNIPVMVEVHGNEYTVISKKKDLINNILNKLMMYSFHNANRVRALNWIMRDWLIEIGVKPEKIRIINNRVNFSLFSKPKENFEIQGPIKIISVGGFTWFKGFETALKAAKSLNENKIAYEMVLIGGGELKSEFESYISEHSLNVKLYDRLKQECLVDLLRQSDIYIQPSNSEGMPRSIIEAMAMRLPIISTRVGFVEATIIHEHNGLLIEKEDFSALSKSIVKLANNELLRIALAHNAYKDALQYYDWDTVFNHYRDEILQLVNEKQND